MTGRRFSSLCLWISIACAYCVAFMLICLNVILIFMIGSLRFVFKIFINGMYVVVALAHATMRKLTQPLLNIEPRENFCTTSSEASKLL